MWFTKFKLSNFPPKCTCMDTWSCELLSCKAMNDLESIGHKEHFAKRVVQFGVLDRKLCHVELPCTLCDHLAITSQPFIRWSWYRTFWKEERKVFNFHIHQKSIWSFFDVEKSSWMWTKNLPFLETFNYRSLSIFGNFCHDFKIFRIDVCHDE
jgi:hypothetical protein